jgi:methionyl-tRNA formyltransferase/peptidoglycan/xylan/chitin deacetylase (PgdA/CDA1 family)
MADSSTRIAVFTGELSYSVRRGIVEIDRNVENLDWLVLVHAPPRTAAKLLKSQWRNLRRNGWRWIPYQIADLWRRIATRPERPVDAKVPGRAFSLKEFKARPNVRVLYVPDIHAEPVLRKVREFAPRLGLSLAAPVLRRALFSIPTLGTVNLHKGRVPDFRGMPPAFWELWTDQSSVGCTVHWVDDGLDTGAIASQATIERDKYSSLRGLQLRLDQLGFELMREVVQALLRGEERRQPQPPGGRTYRKPTLAQVAALERRMASSERVNGSTRRILKNGVASVAFNGWRLGGRVPFAPRVKVLLYHRVSDEARDNLTVGVGQFERHMALIRRHCHPVSIEEVMSWDSVPRSSKPQVCITFDDGYLDNYAHAVPILERYQVPAAFFVSTGIVGTDRRFPHDVRRGNSPIPVMQWDHLRAMRASGFTIGSHSVSHIDCAGEPEEKVWQELVQSSADLQRELGLRKEELIFAYPYGGRQHMTPKRLELVRRAGYRGCLSAYGGSNVGTVDRYNVMRSGVHWEFSDQALLLACLGIH